jgi:hypothetical protein
MASSNTALRVTELDFNSIKNNLKDYLRSQSEFQDFDFEGSGMSILLDILAYNTHYSGYYLNMVANEMFLDTAQLRASVLSHAKLIGYTPKSAEGATTQLNILVTPSNSEDNSLNVLTLDKYTKFLGEDINGENYGFVTTNSYTTSKVNNTFSFANVTIKQGEVASYQYIMDPSNIKRSFVIPSSNVDVSTIVITVQESTSNTYTTEYKPVEDVTDVKSDSPVYFLYENADLTYTFSFGDDYIGRKPKNGNIITCTLLNTVGTLSNNISRFVVVEPIQKYRDNISITAAQSSYGGSNKETVEQVRFRAPYNYITQNRAITSQDYSTILLKDYSNIDSVSVWGGEDNVPPVYGKVYLSLKTKNKFFLTNLEKEAIKNDLIRTRNVLTVTPEIIDPDYTFLIIRGKVTYNPYLTSLSATQLTDYVRAAIADYEENELNSFESVFRKSKLQQYIESSEKSITGSDIKVYLQKRLTINSNVAQRYVITTNFPIKKGDYNNKLYSYPELNVYDISNFIRPVFFEEVPSAFTGIDSIQIVNPGVNYASAPTITIIGDGSGAQAIATVGAGRITSVRVTNPGQNYTRATVAISGGGGGTEASLVTKLQTKIGTLRTYYTKINGEKVIVDDNAGSIDYETGTFIIDPVRNTGTLTNDFYGENTLTFNLPIDSEIIEPLRNRIITIDQNDPLSVQFDIVAES